MILKMYDERTDTFYFVDNVKEVTKRHDVTYHICEGDIPTGVSLSLIFVNEETDERCSYDEYYKRNQDKGERVNDSWIIKKNINSIFPCDKYLVYPYDKYKSEEVYSFKVIEVFLNSGELERYMLPLHKDVYLLNSDGKTIDKI